MMARATQKTTQRSDFSITFMNSRKAYVEDRGVRVPMREIPLWDGTDSLRGYDTSGPQGHDVREGLPQPRREWIESRGGVRTVERSHRPVSGDRRSMPPVLAARTRTALEGTRA